MALPSRNLLIRVTYGIAIISMFVFLAWQSWLPTTELVAEAYQNKTNNTLSTASTAAYVQPRKPAKTEQLNPFNTEKVTRYQISGISKHINLKSDIEQQISQHWNTLTNSTLAQQINSLQPIYAVYRDYDSRNNTIILTLGVTKQISGL
ncbi:hypothetical protein [Neptunomonas japonica]|uniref:hypothetical protein n=1 Tax=Neptunomonas japonica TaxID=417574 RepID=UPI0004138310|nr:hypothetical protein [Neptunomonas japonica]